MNSEFKKQSLPAIREGLFLCDYNKTEQSQTNFTSKRSLRCEIIDMMYLNMNQRKTFRYKGLRVNLMGLPVSGRNYEKKEREKKRIYLRSFIFFAKENGPKNLLVVFDIPEKMRKEREWFRRQLVNLGFILIQKSVWVGPSPLPKCFIDYLFELNLKNKFKTFKLDKPYEKD